MSDQPMRLEDGGLIDRSRLLRFTFDGRPLQGYAGDTLASALLANGVRLVGRSFKYHRPRGIFSEGPEEPSALVQIGHGGRAEPNTRATMADLFDGLVAKSQNRWPSLRWDLQALNQIIAPFIPAGFYYKTFMGPFPDTRLWMLWEYLIRRSAGLGKAAGEPDPDFYAHRHAHCEVLVVGAGPAGLAAARAAALTGVRVILVDERAEPGGRLWRDSDLIEGAPALQWLDDTLIELRNRDNVRLLSRTTAFGYYDDNLVGCVERVADHLPAPAPGMPRQRLWRIRAARVILATGAIEQPLVFANNDRPGIMLAGAARAYVNAYGVRPGNRVLVFTTHDDGYRTAIDLHAAGIDVCGVVDPRPPADAELVRETAARGIRILARQVVVDTRGSRVLRAALVRTLNGGLTEWVDCDLLAVSGGWQPAVHLHSQTGVRPVWDAAIAAFVPGRPRQQEVSVGAAAGRFGLAECLMDGTELGLEAGVQAGGRRRAVAVGEAGRETPAPIQPLWEVPDPTFRRGKKFVDLQDDVTAADVRLARREGFESVEHLKRYTTLGMGTDQGKTSNVPGLAIMAGLRELDVAGVGTTTYRPPYTPVAIGAVAGPEVGPHFRALRRSPMDDWHTARGCVWLDAGLWRRPRYYPAYPGEGVERGYVRESRRVRSTVGVSDVSTLGKIDIQGPDAVEFLNRIYANGWSTLAVGRVRYGLMLREDGIVLDDGTTSRLGEGHFLMTTTTAHAVPVMRHLEFHLQAVWPALRVHVTSVTDHWAAIAVAGPASRRLMQKLVDIDLANGAFPFMACGPCTVAGVRARLFRISFSGELAYELNVPADYGHAVWELVLAAGEEFDAEPYGLEALGNLRIEKGHVTGAELNGQTTAHDVGLGRMVSVRKPFVGRRLALREGLMAPDRQRLVGLLPEDGRSAIGVGAQLTMHDPGGRPARSLGHVTSAGYSTELEQPVALALLEGGHPAHQGDLLWATFPMRGTAVRVRVTAPCFVDPEGVRMHG